VTCCRLGEKRGGFPQLSRAAHLDPLQWVLGRAWHCLPTSIKGLKWRPFSVVGQAVFSLPGAKLGGEVGRKEEEKEELGDAELVW